MMTLSCGHPHEPGLASKVGDSITCYICKCTVQVMASSNSPRPPRPPRFVVDSMLSCVLQMMQDVQQINNTGDTWENILARAKVRLYDDLDAAAGPPRYNNPAPPPVDWEAKYRDLYKDLDAIRAVLGMAPHPDKGLNAGEVYNEVEALVKRCKALKTAIIPTPYDPHDQHRPFGVDYNGLVYLINSLVKT